MSTSNTPQQAMDTQMAIRFMRSDIKMLDALRRQETDIPSRAEMIRRIIRKLANENGLNKLRLDGAQE